MYDFVSIFLEEITENVFKLQSSLPAFGANMIVKFQTIGFSLEAKSLGAIHLRRLLVLGGEGCPHVPMVKRSQHIRIKNPLHKHFSGMPMVGG